MRSSERIGRPPARIAATPRAAARVDRHPALALQRTVGNRAARTLLAAPPGRVLRVRDLNALYGGRTEIPADERAMWLDVFTRIQKILLDQATVKKHLAALGEYMAAKNVSASAALAASEEGRWSPSRPILTDFVPGDFFTEMLRRGQLFEDLVGYTHGTQAHRLQWYVIRAELGPEAAAAAYRESGNPRWAVGTRTVWDFIVDETGQSEGVFVQPDRLEEYVVSLAPWKWKPFGLSGLETLGRDVQRGHEEQPARKAEMQKRYPTEAQWTPKLTAAKPQHQQLVQQRDAASGPDLKALVDQTVQLERTIRNEIVVTTTTVDGRPASYQWTGWIPLADSQAGKSGLVDAYFVPSVAYRVGEDVAQGPEVVD